MDRVANPPPRVANRLRTVLLHVPFYSIEGIARLSEDTGFSRAALSRLASHKSNPSHRIAETIARAVSKRTGLHIDPSEIFSADGTYPTESACDLMGCGGCLPPDAWDEETDALRPEWLGRKPGEWSRSEVPSVN